MIRNNADINGTVYKKKIKNNFLQKIFLLFFILGVCVCGFFASRMLQTKGYTGLWDFITTFSSNYWAGMDADPENISIEIKDKDFKFLEKNRNAALERGVIINDLDGDYVSAELEYQGKKIKVKLRLKGHMTDHLQNDKWSFRIKVKDKDSFMGMKRFSIQHPGTRGYVYEWIYHELMKREGVIALRYKFINVTVNGRDWGIYAVEENFENELIDNNARKRGPIIRFNPDMYWVHRYNMMEKKSSVDEYATYYSANPEAYREADVLSDSTQRSYYLKAIALIEGMRIGKLGMEQVFDISRLAKFHAIIDLVGGENSIDWSDVKYYYNPITQRLEPIAYESFTDFTMKKIAGTYKYVQLDSNTNYENWHTNLFSNQQFFKEYIKELERISSPVYLDNFFSEANSDLKKNLAIVYKEFPYKKFDKQGYYRNQKMIKKILETPNVFHAYYSSVSNNQIHLQLGSIESLPIEITSLFVGGKLAVSSVPVILPAKQFGQYVDYKDCFFSLPKDIRWNDSMISSLKVNYSILGSKNEKELSVHPFPHTDNEFISDDLKNKKSTITDFTFLEVNELTKTILIKSGKQILTKDLIIPSGYKLVAYSGVLIDMKNNSKIISYSPLIFEGTEDEAILIESSDSTSQGIQVINANGSVLKYVIFKNLPKINDQQWARTGAITFYESSVVFKNCSFYNCKSEDAVNLIRSKFSFTESLFNNMANDALDIDFSEGEVNNCVFEYCNENALDITMGKVKVKSLYINSVGNKAINVKAGTELTGNDIRIKNGYIAVSAEDMSIIILQKVTILNAEIGVVAYKNKPAGGHPTITLTGLILTNVKKDYIKERKATILVNGIDTGDEIKDVETVIKGDKKKHK